MGGKQGSSAAISLAKANDGHYTVTCNMKGYRGTKHIFIKPITCVMYVIVYGGSQDWRYVK